MSVRGREKNRVREHSGPSHELHEREANAFRVGLYDVGEARRYECACGWHGWMRPGLASNTAARTAADGEGA